MQEIIDIRENVVTRRRSEPFPSEDRDALHIERIDI